MQKYFLIGVYLLYNVVLVPAVQQCESAMCCAVLSRSDVSNSLQPREM